MSDLVLQLKQINKYFGRSHVIKDVNIDFEKGHFVTFLGPSGCGKNTLLRMVAGFYEPDDGEILLNGKRIERIPPYSRNTAMVFQEYALFPHMNVFDNVSYGLRVKNRPKEEIERRVKEALDLMQLKGMEDRFPNQMSGGQQQRVAVARALVMNPEVLLLDEPLSNLDAQLRQQARTGLVRIHEIYKPTMIYVTHDQVEAMTVADRIVVLKDGELQQIAAPDTIYRHPANTFVAGFIGAPSMNILKARFNRDCICIGKAVLPVPELWRQVIGQRRDLLLGIRPEHCRLSEDAAVQGSITYVENTGNQRTVELQLESGENISVTVSDRNADVQNSSGICFSWDDVSLFDVTSGRNIGYIEKGEVFTDAMGS